MLLDVVEKVECLRRPDCIFLVLLPRDYILRPIPDTAALYPTLGLRFILLHFFCAAVSLLSTILKLFDRISSLRIKPYVR